jgi:predicted phosphohydrolase
MRVAWATDIHLNFLGPKERAAFYASIRHNQPDAVFLTGDIAEAPSLTSLLAEMRRAIRSPLYFVLGNHDFYHGAISKVRANLEIWCKNQPGLIYLSTSEVIELTPTIALIGHDGWGDGRYGNFQLSPVRLSDQELIEDFQQLNPTAVLEKLHTLGDEAAGYLRKTLYHALSIYRHVVCLTHVPPLKEACWYQGKTGNDDWLPYFACQAVGDVLLKISQERTDCRITVLCGHTHHAGTVQVTPNLRILTGSAEYGAPCIQDVFDLEDLFFESDGVNGGERPSTKPYSAEQQL